MSDPSAAWRVSGPAGFCRFLLIRSTIPLQQPFSDSPGRQTVIAVVPEDPIQGMGKDLKKKRHLKVVANKKHHLPLLQVSFCLISIFFPIPPLRKDLVTSNPLDHLLNLLDHLLDHLLCNLLWEESNVGQDPVR